MIHTMQIAYAFVSKNALKYFLIKFGVDEKNATEFISSKLNGTKTPTSFYKQFGHQDVKMRSSPLHRFRVFCYYGYFYLTFTIDANYLLTGQTSIDLFVGTPDNIKKLKANYKNFMHSLIPFPTALDADEYDTHFNYELNRLYDLDCSSLWRIDYAMNIEVDPSLTSLYIKLLNKSVHSKRYPHNNKFKYNAMRVSNKSVTVTVYDKYKALQQQNQFMITALGLLRYEVQYKKSKINSLMLTFNQLLSDDYALKVLTDTATKLFPHGDWYNRYYAEKKINASLNKRSAQTILNFLELVQRSNSLKKAHENYISTATESQFQTLVKKMNQIKVSPYLIPKNEYSNYKLAGILKNGALKNPFSDLMAS